MIQIIKISGALGAIFALLAVTCGAFGAHGLKHKLTTEALAIFEVAVRYQFFHSMALLVFAALYFHHAPPIWKAVPICFTCGIILFSGSLYAIALGAPKMFGAITPLGGLVLLIGWLLFTIGFFQTTN